MSNTASYPDAPVIRAVCFSVTLRPVVVLFKTMETTAAELIFTTKRHGENAASILPGYVKEPRDAGDRDSVCIFVSC